MSRPVKLRRIKEVPTYNYFKPVGVPKINLTEVSIKVEEFEAMRLKDVEKLNQEECAELMKVSRQTFQLIIDNARRKVATALIEGNAIKIEGGNYTLNICKYECSNCGEILQFAYENDVKKCPNCGELSLSCKSGSEFCINKCIKGNK